MSTDFYDGGHIKAPFTYYVNPENNKDEQIKKSLPLWQKITAVAVLIIFSPLLIVGGYLGFLCVTAAFKNRNISAWNKNRASLNNKSNPNNPPKSADPVIIVPAAPPSRQSKKIAISVEKVSLIAEPKIGLPECNDPLSLFKHVNNQENPQSQVRVELPPAPEKVEKAETLDQVVQNNHEASPGIDEIFLKPSSESSESSSESSESSSESSESSSDSINWDNLLNSIHQQDIKQNPEIPESLELPPSPEKVEKTDTMDQIDHHIDENEALLGRKISVNEACQYMDLINEDLALDEITLVLRSDGLYQYVKFKGYAPPHNGLFDLGDGIIMSKPLETFQKLDNNKYVQGIVTGVSTQNVFEENEIVFSTDALRTVQMKSILSNFPSYNSVFNTLAINEKPYFVISSKTKNFFSYPTASCGSNLKREVTTLDPENSPVLKQHFEALKKQLLGKEHDEILILNTALAYVRNVIFPTHSLPNLESQVTAFINQKLQDTNAAHTYALNTKVPVISIDEFIERGIGVCRHHALVTAYLLDGLTQCTSANTQKPFLVGNVKFVRSNVVGGAHAWVNFTNKNRKIHIDTLWNVADDFSTAEGKSRLQARYGKEAIENQLN